MGAIVGTAVGGRVGTHVGTAHIGTAVGMSVGARVGTGVPALVQVILKFAPHPTAWSVRFADKVVPLTVIWNVSPKVSVPTQLAFDTADGHV